MLLSNYSIKYIHIQLFLRSMRHFVKLILDCKFALLISRIPDFLKHLFLQQVTEIGLSGQNYIMITKWYLSFQCVLHENVMSMTMTIHNSNNERIYFFLGFLIVTTYFLIPIVAMFVQSSIFSKQPCSFIDITLIDLRMSQ